VLKHRIIGLMSGTSLDGLDIALCTISWDGTSWSSVIESAETVRYSEEWKARLSASMTLSAAGFVELDAELGRWMGEQVRAFLSEKKAAADFVASHGHTVFHQPQKGYTVQIGNGASLAAACGLPVVCDFRMMDVALGGQGAPLVPIGDRLLFGEYDFCLNLGGIANISYEFGHDRLAFDICPVNMALDYLAKKAGMEFDRDGLLARSGAVHAELLARMNELDYYASEPPKSLGREWFDSRFLPLIQRDDISTTDLLATCCEHIAMQTGNVLLGWNGEVLVTGGGAWNVFLVERMQAHCSTTLIVPDAELVNFKEALVFALLGALRWNVLANTLDTVTGASRCVSSGVIWMPGEATHAG
jgi:anhydro-N-acetylmuramic acid kinase